LGLESLYRLGDKDGLSMVRVRQTAPRNQSVATNCTNAHEI
jgi:hypothetical protein